MGSRDGNDSSDGSDRIQPPPDDGTMFSVSADGAPATRANSPSPRTHSDDAVSPPTGAATLFSIGEPEENAGVGPSTDDVDGVDGPGGVDPPDSAGTLLLLAGPDDAETRTAPPTPGHPPPAAGAAGAGVRDRLTATLPGRYDVGDELGRGGMGMVLTAFDRNAQREVAIKRMLAGMPGEHERRFVQEGQVTAQLEHPAVVPVHDVGVDEHGHVFFAMKLVRGESLGERIARAVRDVRAGIPAEQAFPMLQRLDVVRRVGEALAFAHSRRVIHRDLKPDNVMIGAFGEVLVMDWGLARILDLPADATDDGAASEAVHVRTPITAALRSVDGTISGTPAYMSPEQARGDVADLDERSDVYALGALLYELLTFTEPFRGDPLVILSAVRDGHLDPPGDRAVAEFGAAAPQVPRELAAVVLRAMATDRAHRYESAAALTADVDAWLSGRALDAVDYSSWQLVRKWIVRHRVPVTISAAAAVVLLAMAIVFVLNLDSARRDAEAASVIASEQAELASQRADEVAEQRNIADQRRAEAEDARRTAEADRRRAESSEREMRLAFDNMLASRADMEPTPLRRLCWLAEGSGPYTAARSLLVDPLLATYEHSRYFPHRFTAIAISPDSSVIAGAWMEGNRMRVTLFDGGTLKELCELSLTEQNPVTPHLTSVDGVTTLWLAGRPAGGGFRIVARAWRLDGTTLTKVWESPEVESTHVRMAVTHDERLVAVGGYETVVFDRQKEDAAVFRTGKLTNSPTALAFDGDGSHLAVITEAGAVFHATADWSFCGRIDGAVDVWSGGTTFVTADADASCTAASFGRDGRVMALGNLGYSLFDSAVHPGGDWFVRIPEKELRVDMVHIQAERSPSPVQPHRGDAESVATSEHRLVAATSAGMLETWRLDVNRGRHWIDRVGQHFRMLFSADGRLLLSVTPDEVLAVPVGGVAGSPVPNPAGTIDHVIAMPDGAHLLVADGVAAHVIRIADGELVQQVDVPEGLFATDVDISPDGRWLAMLMPQAAVGSDATPGIRVYEISSGRLVASGLPDAARVRFTPEGELFVILGNGDLDAPTLEAGAWSFAARSDITGARADLRRTATMRIPAEIVDHALSITPDGTRLTAIRAGVSLTVVDLATGEIVATRELQCTPALLPDGRSMLEVIDYNVVCVVDVLASAELARTTLASEVRDIIVSPDGCVVAFTTVGPNEVLVRGGVPLEVDRVRRASGFAADLQQLQARRLDEAEEWELRERVQAVPMMAPDPPAAHFWRLYWSACRGHRQNAPDQAYRRDRLREWVAAHGPHRLATIGRSALDLLDSGRDPALALPVLQTADERESR